MSNETPAVDRLAAASESIRPSMTWRRAGFATLVLSTSGALLWLMALTLFVDDVDPIGLLMLARCRGRSGEPLTKDRICRSRQ